MAACDRSGERLPTSSCRSSASRTGPSFEERFGIDVDLRRIGYLFLAPSDDGLRQLEQQVDLQHRFGVRSEILTARDIATRWPSLRDLDVAGASFCPTDGFLNQHRVLHAVTRAVEAAGVLIECGADVIGMSLKAGRIAAVRTTAGTIDTDLVVNCAGAWAPRVAEPLGITLPIRGRRVQLMLARPTPALPGDLPWLIDLARDVHIRQDLEGRAQVGGFLRNDETVDPEAFDHDADPAWIDAVIQQIADGLGIHVDPASVVDSWAGLYPSTPDQHPIIDRTDAGMVIVGGFAGAGLMHAPAAGLVTAELILDGQMNSIDAERVNLARFSKPSALVEWTGF